MDAKNMINALRPDQRKVSYNMKRLSRMGILKRIDRKLYWLGVASAARAEKDYQFALECIAFARWC